MYLYRINDHPEMGGGEISENFDDVDLMHKRATDLLTEDPEMYVSFEGFVIAEEFEYKPVEKIVAYGPVVVENV